MGALIKFAAKYVGLGWTSVIVYGVIAAIIAGAAIKAYDWAYDNGFNESTVAWQARDNEELRTANALITQLQNEARAAEQQHTENLNAIAKGYEDDKAKNNADNERKIARLLNGTDRLRVPTTTACKQASPSGDGETGTRPGESYGEASAELLPAFSAALKGILDDADEVAIQVTRLQEVVIEDRRLCGVTAVPN
jgi:hypothetical protein